MFTVIEQALATCKRWGNITNPAFDPDLTMLLNVSKATESFRPYIIAAYWVATGATTERALLHEAVGEAKFLKPEELDSLINRLLALQSSFDKGLTNIPAGWTVDNLKATLCKGCSDNETVTEPTSFGLGLYVA
jgi:hypothetical protein